MPSTYPVFKPQHRKNIKGEKKCLTAQRTAVNVSKLRGNSSFPLLYGKWHIPSEIANKYPCLLKAFPQLRLSKGNS